MRKQINEILGKIEDKELTFGEGANALLLLCNSSIQLKEFDKTDFEKFKNNNFIEVDGFYQSIKTGYMWTDESVRGFYKQEPKA